MPEIPLYNMAGEAIGELPLPDAVFGVAPSAPLVHQAVVAEEANRRQGTADTKTRGEIRGGGKKPWRQKGTGHARQGSTRAPHWRHGGVVFGPHPRDFSVSLPKKMRRGALRAALSAKVAEGGMLGLDVVQIDTIRTKDVVAILKALPLTREMRTKHWEKTEVAEGETQSVVVRGTRQTPCDVLLIIPAYDDVLLKSCRNIPYVTLRYAPNFSVRDVVRAHRVVLAQGAVPVIEEVLG